MSSSEINQFKAYVQQIVAVDDTLWQQMETLIELKQYKRKELFHREGLRCTQVGFILNGCFRSVKEVNGEERTFDFATENEFITDYYSMLNKTPSDFNIIAVEDSFIALMKAEAVFELFDSHITWQKFGRHIAERTWCYYQQRLLSAYFDTPRQRYEKLLAEWPDVVLRVPQHIIANYLGVTKETLSRIRKKMSH